jgi:nitroimidazol reductase NimA-like FMN-containing flavoprotein (pyridoxamine 5'-phosphate oxidase superfamily)
MSPTTALDPRYSNSTAAAVGWDETRKLLETAELFWICTVRADGRPHVTPLVAVWVDGAIYFHTGAEEQKFANLHTNPHVALVTGCNSWDRGIDVVVEGDAVRVTDGAVLSGLTTAWAAKWDGRWRLAVGDDGGFRKVDEGDFRSEVFSVTPTKIYAHAKGDPFGQTTHRF